MKLQIGHIGLNTDGCFAEYVKCDSRFTAKLPDEVSFLSAAPLACAGRTAWRSILQAGVTRGQWICFIGSGGGLGHLGVQFAKALGLKVIGVDARDEGLALSKKHGADIVADAREGKEAVVRIVHSVTDGKGAHATVCLADHPEASGIACAVTRMHGNMIQIAQPEVVEIPYRELIFRDVRVKGSCISGPEETKGMLKLIAEHGVECTTVPFNGLERVQELSRLVHSGKMTGKAMIIIDPEQIEHEKTIGAKY
jgi:D-arabinose 1-dehydrogenase-like Zn-dependent alcohol dehydrogenase